MTVSCTFWNPDWALLLSASHSHCCLSICCRYLGGGCPDCVIVQPPDEHRIAGAHSQQVVGICKLHGRHAV